jgi:hypothetical protein
MESVVADNGLLTCVPLTIFDDCEAGIESDEEPLCWREGVQYIESRIEILKHSRIDNISLIALSRHLGVRWSHFLEWAEAAHEDVFLIFTNHKWYDEITSPDEQFVRLRRDQLAVGDYFASL